MTLGSQESGRSQRQGKELAFPRPALGLEALVNVSSFVFSNNNATYFIGGSIEVRESKACAEVTQPIHNKARIQLRLRISLYIPGSSPRTEWLLRTTPGMTGDPGPGSTAVEDFNLGMF